MKARTALATIIGIVALALTACGPEGGRGASAGPPRSDPDKRVSSAPCPLGLRPGDVSLTACRPNLRIKGPRYQLVTPRPGMADLHPVAWHRASGRGRSVLVRYYSGVEPCNVLDHVDVTETRTRVVITLYEGHDPNADSVACIEIAVLKAVKVRLDRPLGGRSLVNGAPENFPTDVESGEGR